MVGPTSSSLAVDFGDHAGAGHQQVSCLLEASGWGNTATGGTRERFSRERAEAGMRRTERSGGAAIPETIQELL